MRTTPSILLHLLAAAAVAVLLPGAVGLSPSATFRPERGTTAGRFHAGTGMAEGKADPACGGKGCHVPSSHRKGGAAAFLNMHEGYVKCLACHGKEAESRWSVSRQRADRRGSLAYSPGDRAGAPHDALGAPVPCERCHSEAGRERLAAAGWKDIPQGFASPIPLRMLREGGRKWVPDDIR